MIAIDITALKDEGRFAGSYAKIARAQKFIDELSQELERYKSSNPISVRLINEEGPTKGHVHLSWRGVTLAPGAIVGDAIHNLRTALDLMASELARINGKSDNRVYFPFAASSEEFEDQIKDKNFTRAGQDAVKLLREFAPYAGGNKLLRALHDLDIHDKHRALILAGSSMNIQIQGVYQADNPAGGWVFAIPRDVQYTFQGTGDLKGLNVIETLKGLVELVHGILEAFSNLVDVRNVPGA